MIEIRATRVAGGRAVFRRIEIECVRVEIPRKLRTFDPALGAVSGRRTGSARRTVDRAMETCGTGHDAAQSVGSDGGACPGWRYPSNQPRTPYHRQKCQPPDSRIELFWGILTLSIEELVKLTAKNTGMLGLLCNSLIRGATSRGWVDGRFPIRGSGATQSARRESAAGAR